MMTSVSDPAKPAEKLFCHEIAKQRWPIPILQQVWTHTVHAYTLSVCSLAGHLEFKHLEVQTFVLFQYPIFQELLPFHVDRFGSLRQNEHSKQLYCHSLEVHGQYMLHRRSIFGMVPIYNRLPQSVVDCPSVSAFQSQLTKMATEKCKNDDQTWRSLFSARI